MPSCCTAPIKTTTMDHPVTDNKIVRHRQANTCLRNEDTATHQSTESSLLPLLIIPPYFRYLKGAYLSTYKQYIYSFLHLPNGDSKYRYSTRFIMKQFFLQASLQTLFCLLLCCIASYVLYSSIILHIFDPYSYVIVLDAGSTGTRVHVYKFLSHYDNVTTYVLKSEIFEERTPGLSSYADHIDNASAQIKNLLDIAEKSVTRFKQRSTPIVFRATAGLRLLNETKSRQLLQAVSQTFGQYRFYRSNMDVAIMDETDEGIDAWLTLVYLQGEQFYSTKIAALDLGGGSTQITYNPPEKLDKMSIIDANKIGVEKIKHDVTENDQLKRKNKNHVESITTEKILSYIEHNEDQNKSIEDNESSLSMSHLQQFQMFDRDIQLYSKSYLGYGLMIARQTIFINETIDERKIDLKKSNDYYVKLIQKEKLLKTHCMPKKIKGKFKFQEYLWQVESHSSSMSDDERFYQCIAQIDDYVRKNVQKAVGLEQMTIYAFSYFYDVIYDAGLLSLDNGNSPTMITKLQIRTLKQAAKNICRGSTHLLEKHPFLCFDLTYIFSLLTTGYKLSENTNINICKKIRDFEVAWSLGLALKLL
ncbi:unnamed protein product [Didymodactylos carnosus]|uniref:Ectonucleoside triphosphate diphosphohydrolase 5 n=3 Tax=Didymodactylos carnosus TaxID=1234261 RepID=A0A814FFD5_9BILA|nr:unnamed protein product [Didymodactylos carnosus]CAF3757269.1 unnamed protein product [Didymodactylos carnosus]